MWFSILAFPSQRGPALIYWQSNFWLESKWAELSIRFTARGGVPISPDEFDSPLLNYCPRVVGRGFFPFDDVRTHKRWNGFWWIDDLVWCQDVAFNPSRWAFVPFVGPRWQWVVFTTKANWFSRTAELEQSVSKTIFWYNWYFAWMCFVLFSNGFSLILDVKKTTVNILIVSDFL